MLKKIEMTLFVIVFLILAGSFLYMWIDRDQKAFSTAVARK